ncbi:MAG: Ig-like domain-containing protein [Patescibacteria group bacterium]|nr:Ig-like domain-containing protein [Patescibacteria group bacterium]
MLYKKSFLTLALALTLIIAAFTTWQFFFKSELIKNTNTEKPPLVSEIDYDFTLRADNIDSLGVDKNSSFTLDSQHAVEKDKVKTALAISPSLNYKLESSNNKTFKIVPEKELATNTIYNFKINTVKPNPGQEKEFAWAFQTKDIFKITSTLPRDKATSVPLDSGIEITFSHENYENYEDYIEIQPKPEGNFKKYRKTLVFVPKSLKPATLYTVKIKKGLPLAGTDKKLSKEIVFRFETEASEESTSYSSFRFIDNFYEFPNNDAPVLSLYERGTEANSVEVKVWKFHNFEAYKNAVIEQYKDIPYWASLYRKNKPYPTDSLESVSSFTADLQQTNFWYEVILFPDNLKNGYYLVEAEAGEEKDQSFLQISSLSTAFYGSPNKSFMWVNSLNSDEVVSDIKISFSENEDFSASTDSQGLAEFETPLELQDEEGIYYRDSLYFFTLSKGSENLLVPTEDSSYSYWGRNIAQNKYYWSYLYPNRNLYQPTDKIYFWGIAKKRNGSNLENLTIKLAKTKRVNGEEKITTLAKTSVNISEKGTYQGELSFSNINPGYYSLLAIDNGEVISRESINIKTYTKPPYKIEITTPKKAIFEGEKAVYKLKASFFDGTPVSGLELKYNGKFGDGQGVTDDKGEIEVSYETSYTQNNYYPYTAYLRVHPKNSEVADITATAYFRVFGPHYDIDLTAKKGGEISGLIYNVSLDKINAEPDKYIWDYEGDPVADISADLKIYHLWYEKIEKDTSYDFINKKTVKNYRYEKHEDLIEEESLITNEKGIFSYSFNPESEKNYKIVVTTNDNQGRVTEKETYYYSKNNYSSYYHSQNSIYDSYYLVTEKELDPENSKYNIEEEVKLTLNKNESPFTPSESDKILYFKDQNGIFDVGVSNQANLSFQFEEKFAPNIYVSGIVFDGRSYHTTHQKIVEFDSDSKKLNIKTFPDKAAYKPGEKAELAIEVTDQNNDAVKKAEVNVSLIDEALAMISWERWGNIQSKIYSKIPSSLTASYTSHKKIDSIGAEGGGCFTGDTQILMSDKEQKNIGQVEVGEYVLTREKSDKNKLVKAKVVGKSRHFLNEYLEINGFLKATPVHIVYLNGVWQPIGRAKLGDQLELSSGKKIFINSIIKHNEPVTVYNLHIENYHTFFADNVYVHNNKAGRDNFQDIAFFGTAQTDGQGKAKVNFKLPDNITSWQTSVQAVTDDLKVGDSQTAIIVTQPFFVNISMAKNYLTDDKPKIKLRSFGQELSSGEEVNFEVNYPDQDISSQKYTAKSFELVEFSLPDLPAGKHKIRVKATAGNLEDIVTKEFNLIKTNHKKYVVDYYTLTEGLNISGNEDGLTNLTFTNKERGQYYNLLKRGLFSGGDRVDQKMMQYYSQVLLNNYFDKKTTPETFDFSHYQTEKGGISLLPYSSEEILLTAKALATDTESFSKTAAKEYFYDILEDSQTNTDEAVYAYLGLANLGEPVLTDINLFLQNENLTPELKLYLIRAVANIGAKEYAHSLLNDLIKVHGVEEEPYIRINLGTQGDDYTEYSYQAAVVGAIVGSDKAFELFNYAINHPAENNLHNLDQIAYLIKALPNLNGQAVSFSYSISGENKEVSLENNEILELVLNSNDRKNISFSDITGTVGLVANYEKPADIDEENQDANIAIDRDYYVGYQLKDSFSEDEIIKITLNPTVSSQAIDKNYRVTDYLPSGLKILTKTWQRNISYDKNMKYPYEINGQAIKFKIDRSSESFHYYALVTGKGEYKAEAPVIQGFNVEASKAFGSTQNISIE